MINKEREYIKEIYENKEEFEIVLELFESLDYKYYYFYVGEDFNGIDFQNGMQLEFKDLNGKFIFIGSICKYDEFYQYIEIKPVDNVKTIEPGEYLIKEHFNDVPFTRMSTGLFRFCFNLNSTDLSIKLQILNHNVPTENEDILDKLFEKDKKIINEVKAIYKLNQYQQEALNKIYKNNFNLILGPPGTGKTALGAFLVLNILLNRKKQENQQKILVSAASNNACDNFAEKIIRLLEPLNLSDKFKIIRLCSKSYESYSKLSEKVKKICYHNLPKEERLTALEEADVVICTCINCLDDRINGFDFPFVIIDETTQAKEPECLLPMIHGAYHVTLIGDDKQLGPIVKYPDADKLKMNLSLFERLNMKKDKKNFTMLKVQYRMHPKVAEFSNKYIYGGQLENGVTEKDRELNIYNRKFFSQPIVFINVNGQEEKYGSSNYNTEEADIIIKIVNSLQNDCKIKPKDIGIITPYLAQSKEIKSYLSPRQKKDIEVSSVDSFQGKEKKYIIISTVRANDNNDIGFLVDERRLNVMLTRAKFGTIIVGNIKTLYNAKEKMSRSNPIRSVNNGEPTLWNELIEYYHNNNCLVEWGTYEFRILSLYLLLAAKEH